MQKKITFNFWRIEMPRNERRQFEDFIELAIRIKDLGERVRTLAGYPIRMERGEYDRNVWIGEMIKLRMEELPVKAGIRLPVSDLGLGQNEGVGEPNGFLYDPQTQVLITHGEHFGVSAVRVAEYFEQIGNCRAPIHVEPVLTEDAWRKFRRMKKVKSFTFKIGRSINRSLLTGTQHSLRRTLDTLANRHGLQMEIAIGVGRSRSHSLDKQQIKTDISALLACHQENHESVTKLEATGVNSEGKTEPIDFLEARMKYVDQVELGAARRLTFKRRRHLLFMALREHSEELERIYGDLA